jgi:hypothetical protein
MKPAGQLKGNWTGIFLVLFSSILHVWCGILPAKVNSITLENNIIQIRAGPVYCA